MKIPKKLKIGNLIFKISQLEGGEKDDFYGLVNIKYQHLKLDFKELSGDKLGEAFFHEIVHAILDQHKFTEASNDEKLVATLGNGLYQVIKDNKLLK